MSEYEGKARPKGPFVKTPAMEERESMGFGQALPPMESACYPPGAKPLTEAGVVSAKLIEGEELQRDLENRFSYHAPVSERQMATYTALRSAMKRAAESVVFHCPPGRERSAALTKLEEAMFFACASVARNPGKFEEGTTQKNQKGSE